MREHMAPLLEAIRTQDATAALQWSHQEQWSTMKHLLQASGKSCEWFRHGLLAMLQFVFTNVPRFK